MMNKSFHYYTMKESSWPLIASLQVMNMLLSAIFLMKFKNQNLMIFNLFNTSATAMMWWSQIKKEMNQEGSFNLNTENSMKMSMMLFIASEIMLFLSMFWSYFSTLLTPSAEISMSWPPENLEMFSWENTPSLNTLILLCSGITITMAHYMMITNKMLQFKILMWTTIMMGMLFTFKQLEEYKNSFFTISDGVFGSNFYMTTGLHGIHVAVGTTFMIYNMKVSANLNNPQNMMSFNMAAWYWHFVDLVWLLVFSTFYYINN